MFFPVTVQVVVMLLVAAMIGLWSASSAGLTALYGGLAALANTVLLIWHHKRGARDYHCDGARHLRSFYRSSLERFLVVGIWLAIGLGGLRLEAKPLLIGFVVGLLAWVVALAVRK